MTKKRASEATVNAFCNAVYPEMTELAMMTNGEEEILRDATAELTRLRELERRAEDVEGMAKVLAGGSFNMLFENAKEGYRADATALSRWMKEGGE